MNGKQFICNSSIMTDSTLSRSAKWLYVVLSFLYGQYGLKRDISTVQMNSLKMILELKTEH